MSPNQTMFLPGQDPCLLITLSQALMQMLNTQRRKFYLDKNSYVAAVFVDFKRAFDTVNHFKLLSRLLTFGFSNQTVKWIQSYLSDRKQCVQIKNCKSPYLQYTQGVPQGSIIGPLLFSLYANSLPNVCKNVDTIMYADDTVIFTHAKSADDAAYQLLFALGAAVAQWFM